MRSLLALFIVIATLTVGWMPAEAESCLDTPNSNGCVAGLPAAQYHMLLDEMFMHPTPNVEFLPVNEQEVYRFAFRRLTNPAGSTIYDAPNGNVVGSLAAGFTYVTVHGYEPGWVKINDSQWVVESDTAVIQPSTFAGALLENAYIEHQMAWVLIPSYPAPYPGAEEDRERERIDRYTPVNIFATVEVDGWNWYLIGPDTWIIQTSVAKINLLDNVPEGIKGRWVAVDLYEQVLVAYEGTNPVFATLISSGLPQWSTQEGTFQTWARQINGPMDGAEGRVDFYSLENVPYILYFNESIALHAAYWHDGFGYRHSHGCINMSLTDAHWIFEWTLEGGYEYPWVHVFSTGEYLDEQ